MTQVWRYSVPNESYEGWAILFLDEAGCFSVLSDYGNYAYRWNVRGFPEGLGFRRFLLECDDSYILNKISPRIQDKVDTEKTIKHIKDFILQTRRSGDFTIEEARYEWDLIEQGLDNEYDVWDWQNHTKIDNAYELVCYSPPIDAVMFLKKAWPRLKELIKNDHDK